MLCVSCTAWEPLQPQCRRMGRPQPCTSSSAPADVTPRNKKCMGLCFLQQTSSFPLSQSSQSHLEPLQSVLMRGSWKAPMCASPRMLSSCQSLPHQASPQHLLGCMCWKHPGHGNTPSIVPTTHVCPPSPLLHHGSGAMENGLRLP